MVHIPWQIRWQLRRERWADLAHRPTCWFTGHTRLYKMDLHGGWICRDCRKYGAS